MNSETINHINYLNWFILFADNELNASEIKSLQQFIEANPILKNELEEILKSKIAPIENEFFQNKKRLKKDDPNEISSIILYLDKELNEKEKHQFEQNILFENPTLVQDFKKLYFKPDTDVYYAPKAQLYKKSPSHILLKQVLKYAASILLFIGVFYMTFQLLNINNNKTTEIVFSKSTLQNTHNIKSIDSIKNNAAPFVADMKETKTKVSYLSDKKTIDVKLKNDEVPADKEVIKEINMNKIPQIASIQDNENIKLNNSEILQDINLKVFEQNTLTEASNFTEKNKSNKILYNTIHRLKNNVLNTLSGGSDEINFAILTFQTK